MAFYQFVDVSPQDVVLAFMHNGRRHDVLRFTKNTALIGKLVRPNPLHIGAFHTVVSRAWRNSPKSIHTLGDYIFLYVFANEHDKDVVLENGPWWFMKSPFLLKDCPSSGLLKEMDFSIEPFWVQAHNIPDDFRTIRNAKDIGAMFPTLQEIDVGDLSNKSFDGFIRVKVGIDVKKPLLKGFVFKGRDKDPLWIQFKYERLVVFCYFCGIIGHSKEECWKCKGSWRENYGPELRATPRYVAKCKPDWNDLYSFARNLGESSSNRSSRDSSASLPYDGSIQTTYIMEVPADDFEPFICPIEVHLPAQLMDTLASSSVKSSYQTFDSWFPKLGDCEAPPCPSFPVAPPMPEHPTEEEWEYINRHTLSEEDYKDYKEDLEYVHEDVDDDDHQRAVRKLYLDVETVEKHWRNDLNSADRAWFRAARKFCKIHLQTWAYPIETGVWELTEVGQFRRPALMDAIFNASDEEDSSS